MAIKAVIATQFDATGLNKAISQFSKLGSSIKGALGAVGLSVGIASMANALQQASKAAVSDAKSQALLANQLRNTAGATDATIRSSESFIKSLMLQTSITDDTLRPALATLVRATGDVAKSQDLLTLSTNIAAGTGKDLGAVTIAVGKAVNGQTTALKRLGIVIKDGQDPVKVLTKQFDGMAQSAARTDPYQRLNTLFGETAETIGYALLPYLNEVADYFASPAGQKNLEDFALSITDAVKAIGDLGKGMSDLAPIADPIFGYLNGLIAAFTGNAQRASEIFQGMFGTMTAATNAGRAINQPSAARLAGQRNPASGGLDKAAVVISNASAKASTAAANAAKKAADAAKKAAEAQAKLVASFKSNILELTGAFAPLGQITKELGQFEQDAVDAFDAINEAVVKGLKDKALTQAAADYIYNYIKVEKVALTALARQRDVLLQKIQIAQDISRGVVDAVNITGLLQQETKTVTKSVQSIVNGLAVTVTSTFDEVVSGNLAESFKKLVDKTKTFAKNLVTLKKLGLNGNLFKQIVDAGQEAGGATAEAIIAGGADTVKELNGLFDELNQAGSDIAETSTDTFYNLGEGISNAFIDGLKSQEQALADEIAKMVASIEAAFADMMAKLNSLTMRPSTSWGTNAQGRPYSSDPFLGGTMESQFGSGTPWAVAAANYANKATTQVNVTVNAGLGTNGKAVGQQIQSLLNQYAKASG